MRKATLLKIKGDLAAITFDGTRVINGVKVIGDASRLRVDTQVYVDVADGRPVVLTNGVAAPKPSSTVESGGGGTGTAPHPMSYHTDENEWHRDINPIYVHDPKVHDLLSFHTVSGLTTGHVMKATGATTFGFLALLHSELGGVGPSDHHNPVTIGTGGLSSHLSLATQSLTLTAIQHDEMGGLTDDDHTQYVHNTIARTITAQHTFSPATAIAPFLLSSNAQGQTVTGLKADQLNKSITAGDGLDGGGALTADRSLAVDVTDFIDTAYGLTEDTNNIRINLGSGLAFSTGAIVPSWGTDITTQAIGDTVANGSANTVARSDHKHAMPSFATPEIALGAVAAAGNATTLIRSNATIAVFDTTAPTTIQPDDSAAVGSIAFAARRDHKHAIVAAAPGSDSVGVSASAEGDSTSFSRANHYHNIDEGMTPTWTGTHTFGVATKLQFRDTGLFIQSSADGQLDISADTTIDFKNGATSKLRVKSSTVEVDVELKVDANLNFVGAQSITTTADGLTIAPTTTLTLNPGGDAVILDDTVTIKSTSYTSQTTGWAVTGAGDADFRYLFVDELHAKSFIADLEQALAGGQIISKSVGILSRDFTAPAAGATTTLYVWDLPSAAEMAIFQTGDIVRLRSFSRAAGSLTIADCWGVVTSYSNLADREQSWTFTRSTSSNAGAMVAGTIILYDAIVLDYGTTGNGFYEVNAIDGAYGVNSPYAQIVTWATHPHSGKTTRVRLGNLKGIFSLADPEYGLFAGEGLTVTSRYLRITDTTFEIHNLPIRVQDGTDTRIIIEPSGPYIGVGSTAPTSYLGGDGWWVGNDGGTYKFHLGDVDGERLQWTGSALQIYAATGTYITATGSAITMYSNSLQSITLDGATTSVTIGDPATENVYITASGVYLRNATTVYTSIVDATLTLGNSAAADGYYSAVTAASFSIYERDTSVSVLRVSFDDTSLKFYHTNGTQVLADIGATITLYDTGGADRLVLSTSGVTVGDVTEGEYATITSSGITLYGNAVAHLNLNSSGTLWAGDTSTTERIQWDTTNGLRIYDANNAEVFSSSPAGVTWLSTLVISDSLGQSLFSAADGLLLLGPGCAIAPTSWTSTRGQAATLSGAFHQVAGRWADTRAVQVELATTNYCTNPRPDAGGTAWGVYGGTFSFETGSGPFIGNTIGQIVATSGANMRMGALTSYALTTGVTWVVSFWAKCTVPEEVLVYWQRSVSPYDPLSNTAVITITDAWEFFTVTLVTTETATGQLLISGIAAGNAVMVANVQAEIAAINSSYCDGGLGTGYSWSGTPYASTSRRAVTEINLDAHVGLVSENDTLSFAMWVRAPYAADGTWPNALGNNFFMDLYGSGGRIILRYNDANDRFEAYLNASYYVTGTTQTFAASDWLHIVLTVDFANDSHVLYVNGTQDGSSTQSLSAGVLTEWNLGSRYSATVHGGFAFSEYAVFGRALTAEEVAGMYASGKSLTDMGALKRPGVYILDGEFDIRSSQTGARVQMDADGIGGYSATTTKTFSLETDGDLFLGSDISAAATTALAVFANAQTYNSESLGAGDVLLGDNSAGKINLLWDVSEGDVVLRRGTSARITLDGSADTVAIGNVSNENVYITSTAVQIRDGTTVYTELLAGELILGDDGGAQDWISVSSANGIRLYGNNTLTGHWTTAGAVIVGETANSKSRVEISAGAISLITRSGAGVDATNISLSAAGVILVGQAAASQNNIQISAGALSIRNNATERVGITAAGILTIKDSAGAAVFTFDASAGAEFTKPLTLGTSGGVYQGTGTFASPTTGLKIWNDSGIGRIAGYNGGGSPQWYVNTDGKLYAGGGNVQIDSTGINFPTQYDAWNESSSVKWGGEYLSVYGLRYGTDAFRQIIAKGGGTSLGSVYLKGYSTSSPYSYAELTLQGEGPLTTANGGTAELKANDGTNSAYLQVHSNSTRVGVRVSPHISINGQVIFEEQASTPSNPTSGTMAKVYMKADKLVFQYNDGGTVRYKYLDLTGTGVTWVHSTSAP